MICQPPAHPVEPPAWHISNPGGAGESILMGLATFGTREQASRVGEAAEKTNLSCTLLQGSDGRTEVMVLFNKTTSRDVAFAFYQRVSKGEFGTTDTGMIMLPVSAATK